MISHPYFWRIAFLVFVVVAILVFLDIALIHGSSCPSPEPPPGASPWNYHASWERTWYGACQAP